MSGSLHFELVSPERLLKDMEAVSVVVPGADGDFGVLPNHAPVMSSLRPGVLEISADETSEPELLFLKGGLAQISAEGLTILAEEAIDLASVDSDDLAKKLADVREDIEDASDDVEKIRLQKEEAWMVALQEAVAA